MDYGVKLVFCIISIFIGAGMGTVLFHKPIKIEFKISSFDRFMYAFAMFFIITMVMVLELTINQWQLVNFNSNEWWLKFLSRAVDGGLLVSIALPILSIVFGKWVIEFNLDLCSEYSINVVKIYYSLSIFANCMWFLVMSRSRIVNDDPGVQSILNRVIIWMLNVGGTWAGIGFHCEGRISEELKNIKRSKEKRRGREVLIYSIPFVIAFVINCLLLLMQTFEIKLLQNIFMVIYTVVMSGLIGMLISAWGLNYIKYPSEKRSNRKLAKVISRMNEAKLVSERYQTIQYSLVNEDSKKYMLIHKRNVIWSGHENEISSCLGENKIPLENFEYEECRNYLTQFIANRRDCVQKCYVFCKETVRAQLIEQNKIETVK